MGYEKETAVEGYGGIENTENTENIKNTESAVITENTDVCRPYSVVDVLQKVYHVDFQAVLERYASTEIEEIQAAGVLRGAKQLRIRMWSYLKTLSKLQQPIDFTVVDVILRGNLEGRYEDGTIRYENASFRLRYYLDLRVCHQRCMGTDIQICNAWHPGHQDNPGRRELFDKSAHTKSNVDGKNVKKL